MTPSLGRFWRRSLQFRTVVSTVLVTFLVVGAAGAILVQRVSDGLMDAKQRSALAEVAAGRSIARTYATTSPEPDNQSLIDGLVDDLAGRAGKPPTYDVVVQPAPTAADLPSQSTDLVSIDSVPPELIDAMRSQNTTVWMNTDVVYDDGRTAPGLVLAAPVNVQGVGPYELYYLYGLDDVTRTISLVRSTVVGVGIALVVALGALAWWFSRRLVRPVQQVSRAAAALATGDLSRRMQVHGEDDMARLSESFNSMADSLQAQIEQLRRLSEMQRRFVADVSHELRTPLTTIRMAADVVADDTTAGRLPSPRTSELLVAEVERFDVLLNDLLEVSRFDAGEAVLDAEEVDLAVLVPEWVAALRALAQEQDCALSVSVPDTCPVSCDPRRVGRVVRNLVVNAIEYGAGKPVEVVLTAGPLATLTVTDHGVGLDSAAAERVFERFWRADPSRRRTLGGTGLGLAISREDARLHGGDLSVTGAPGHGCTFTLTLPPVHSGAPA
ncbi:MAG: MtrAB system histidine kinase MtrB [Candidatus Nanopelagicales bacterium]